jgi:hypothetical protein
MFVEPSDTGVTTPVLLTVATPVFDEFHIYVKVPVQVSCEVNDKEPPTQTSVPPVIAPATGNALTVTAKGAEVA